MTDTIMHNDESILFDWAEIEAATDDYDYWQEKRKEDIKYCGYLSYRENPATGRNTTRQSFCNEPDCEHCGPKIRDRMYRALRAHTDERPLRKITLTGDKEIINKERAKIMRKYGGKEKVSTFASDILTEDGLSTQIEILIDTDEEIGEEYAEIDYKDIERWAQKSFNCKKSGNLHSPKPPPVVKEKEEPEEDIFNPSQKVYFEEWIIDYQKKAIVEQIEIEVLNETSDLDPQDFDELKEALATRRELRKKKLEEKKIVILSNVVLFMTLKMTDVQWQWTANKHKPG